MLCATSNDVILADLQRCQRAVHQWGGLNRVAFDPGKEYFSVLDPGDVLGDFFFGYLDL